MHYLLYREIPYSFCGTYLERYYLKYIFASNYSVKGKTVCPISSSSPLITFKVRIDPCYFFNICKMQKPVFRTPRDFPARKPHCTLRMFLLPAIGSIFVQNKTMPLFQAHWNCTNQYTVLKSSTCFISLVHCS